MNDNVFWLTFWALVIIGIFGLAITINNNDNNDNQMEVALEKIRVAHVEKMASKGYIQKKVTSCQENDCRTDLVWVKQGSLTTQQ